MSFSASCSIDCEPFIVEYKMEVPNSGSHLNIHRYLSGEWLDVDLRTDTKKICVEKRLDYVVRIYQPL